MSFALGNGLQALAKVQSKQLIYNDLSNYSLVKYDYLLG
jgi:hypothetical protein